MGNVEDAIALKEQGNKAFKEHNWPTAVEFYTKAIELNDKEPSFYTNRAQVGNPARGDGARDSPSLTPILG